jgi:hypothetical protein
MAQQELNLFQLSSRLMAKSCTCARRLLAAGVPTRVAKSITGHETDSIFSRYAIVDAALMLAAQEKVAAKFPRRSQG